MRAPTTLDDRARVTEARAFASSLAANIRDYRLRDFPVDNELCEFFFL